MLATPNSWTWTVSPPKAQTRWIRSGFLASLTKSNGIFALVARAVAGAVVNEELGFLLHEGRRGGCVEFVLRVVGLESSYYSI